MNSEVEIYAHSGIGKKNLSLQNDFIKLNFSEKMKE